MVHSMWYDTAASASDRPPLPEDKYLQAAMEWHFSPETGSRFWLDRLPSLDFDPLCEVRTHADLRMFPNVADDLRDVPVADLVPRGYGDAAEIIGVYESGGTTGSPKRVLLHADWLHSSLEWTSARMDDLGFPARGHWLVLAPTGPHIFGRLMAELARRRRSMCSTIDLDPRWVRRSIAEGRHDEAERYVEHLIDQASLALEQQWIDVIVVTPPLLERMAARDRLVELVNEKVRAILWGGAHLDPDTRHLLRTEVFPEVGLHGMYGSTTILGGSMERPSGADSQQCVFDSFSPSTTFSVVDPVTLADVGHGRRGQVVMHHVSRSLLLPNNLERDMATAVAPPSGSLGTSVADVTPVPRFQETVVIEGVY